MRWAAALLLCLCQAAACAGELRNVDVRRDGDAYTIDVDGIVDAPSTRVYDIVTDYARLDRISSVLTETALLSAPGELPKRRRVVARACILMFCLHAAMVEDIVRESGGIVETALIPSLSDFRSGHTRWQVEDSRGTHTRLRFHGELEPSFWIPPVIGPWIIKRELSRLARESYTRIEALAHAHG